MTGRDTDPFAGLDVDPDWNPDPAAHPELAPWRKVIDDWTPEDSLKRIDTKAAFVFGNVALVGTLAAGLGLLTGLKIPSSLQWLAISGGALLVLALILALLVTMPSWRSSIPLELYAVKAMYDGRIRKRGWLVRISMLAYAAAFVAGIILVVGSLIGGVEPSLGLTTTSKSGVVVVTGTVTAQSLDTTAETRTRLVGIQPDGTEQTLALDVRVPGATGALSVMLTADPAPAAASFKLQVDYRGASNTMMIRTIVLTP